MKLTHLDTEGNARMVNVGDKEVTKRRATARGTVYMKPETLGLITSGGIKKGDVLTTAKIAAIQAAKGTGSLIPMCHNIFLSGVEVRFTMATDKIDIEAEAWAEAKTGVEMEALTAVAVAALTIYDMAKAVDREMVIGDICVTHKEGGKSGTFTRSE